MKMLSHNHLRVNFVVQKLRGARHTSTRAPRFEFSRGDQQERENLIF
jgi:hypothetical protein